MNKVAFHIDEVNEALPSTMPSRLLPNETVAPGLSGFANLVQVIGTSTKTNDKIDIINVTYAHR